MLKHPEFSEHIKVNVLRLDSIRAVSDGFIAFIDLVVEYFENQKKIGELLDVLLSMHKPLKIPWQYFNLFRDHLFDFMKNILEKDWESDFDDFWGVFLFQMWVALASGTLSSDSSVQNNQKSDRSTNMKVVEEYFSNKQNELNISSPFLSPEDANNILNSYERIKYPIEFSETNLGKLVFNRMLLDEKIASFFTVIKEIEGYSEMHGEKIHIGFECFIRALEEDETAKQEVSREIYESHYTLQIMPDVYESFLDLFFNVIKEDIKVELNEVEILSWKRFLLGIYHDFWYKRT